MSFLEIILWVGVAVLCFVAFSYICCFPFAIYIHLCAKERKRNRPEEVKNIKPKTNFGILIPARDEKEAIIPLLDCLKNIDYPKDLYKVFVILPNKNDENYQRALDYRFIPITREDGLLPTNNIKTKGGALNDAYQQIVKLNYRFDSFVIFDADAWIDDNFLKELNILKSKGFNIGCALRDYNNRFYNFSTASDSLLFSFANGMSGYGRMVIGKKGYITGSGYYVDSWILEENNGWPWVGLTEDIELTDYALHDKNIKMGMTHYAKVYDELSTEFKQTHKQHLRWMFGYFVSRQDKKDIHRKNRITNFIIWWDYNIWGLFIVFLLLAIVLYAILCLVCGFVAIGIEPQNIGWFFLLFFASLLFESLNINLMAALLLRADLTGKLSLKHKVMTILSLPLTFAEFAFGFIEGLLFPKHWKTWGKVEHKGYGKEEK